MSFDEEHLDPHGECAFEIARLNAELETERMRLASCGVAALSDTEKSMERQRIHADNPYFSASYADVLRRTQECIDLRARVAALEAALRTICPQCDMPLSERAAPEAPTNPTHQHAPTCEKLRGLDCTCVPTPLRTLPYPWCRQPSVCRGTCPMDPSCGE